MDFLWHLHWWLTKIVKYIPQILWIEIWGCWRPSQHLKLIGRTNRETTAVKEHSFHESTNLDSTFPRRTWPKASHHLQRFGFFTWCILVKCFPGDHGQDVTWCERSWTRRASLRSSCICQPVAAHHCPWTSFEKILTTSPTAHKRCEDAVTQSSNVTDWLLSNSLKACFSCF